jgi:cob(I)alamin adenosyltransferase
MTKNIYDKADSILELRGVSEKRKQILDLIHAQINKTSIESDDLLQKIQQDLFSSEITSKFAESKFYLRDHVVEEMSRIDKSDFLRYLRYRYHYDIYPTIHKTSDYPPLVQIEPTSRCVAV